MDYSDLYIIDEVKQPTKFDFTAGARKAIKAYFKSIGQKCTVSITDVGRCQFIKVRWTGGVSDDDFKAFADTLDIPSPFEVYPLRSFGANEAVEMEAWWISCGVIAH